VNYLIFGASRGLGAFFSHSLPSAGDTVWLVARSQPDLSDGDGVKRVWIQADLSNSQAAARVAEAIGDATLDVCIYNAGIWERFAFSKRYDFEQVPVEETERIISTNLTAAILCVQKVLPALRRSSNAKIILIGSNAGLENSGRPEVAYTVSKFGLRGLTHALREVVREAAIGVTCLNLGDVGEVIVADGQVRVDTGSSGRVLITLSDILIMLKAIISLSNTSCVKEIDLLAMTDSI
jgi:short-subunit dehydrogenase